MVVGNGIVGQSFYGQVKGRTASLDARLMAEGEEDTAECTAAPNVVLH